MWRRDSGSNALGGFLFGTGGSLINYIQEFRSIYQTRRSEFVLSLLTLVGVLVFGLIEGVALAVGFSLLEFIKRIYRPHTSILGIHEGKDGFHKVEQDEEQFFFPGLIVYKFNAPLFFANSSFFVNNIKTIVAQSSEPVRYLLIDAEAISDIDSSAADALRELYEDFHEQNILIGIAAANDIFMSIMEKTGLLEQIGKDNFYPTIRTGIIAMGERYLDFPD